VELDLTNTDTYTLGRGGDNLTIINDYIGVSGYDGYKHGVIPFLEALGVPQRDILTYEEFVSNATGPDGDEAFFRMLLEPLLGVVDRIVADPIRELPQVLPNLMYFLAAEGGNENMLLDGSAQNGFVEAANRVLRPIYAALDMATPLMALNDAFSLLGVQYPFTWVAGDVAQDVWLAPDLSLNSIVTGLVRRWFADVSDSLGLELTLALQDIMQLVPGMLEVFRSVNGQNDAVRLNADQADLYTHVMRKLINLTFSEGNWQEMRLFIAARLPANTRDVVLFLLDALADMVRGMEEDKAADLVLAVLYYRFCGKDHVIKAIYAMRDCRDRLNAFFGRLSLNGDMGNLALLAGGALLLAGGTAAVAIPTVLAGLGALVLSGLGLGGLAALLFHTKKQTENSPDTQSGIVPPPKTGDSNAVTIGAALIGMLTLGAAILLLQRPKKRRRVYS
jgi:hypothetical protein